MSTIGMMDGAFFVGRKEVVDWINATLNLNIGKIEDSASGAIACQLLDIMHPNQIPMHKVNWAAKQSFEFIANYKLLQTAFAKLHIDKFVDVDRLISGRYMDNLEFMQWFKRFFEMNVSDIGDYDALGQRSKGKGGSTYQFNVSGSGSASGTASTATKKPTTAPTRIATAPSAAAASRDSQNANVNTQQPPASAASAAPTKPKPAPSAATSKPATSKPSSAPSAAHSNNHNHHSNDAAELAQLRSLYEDQSKAFAELKLEVDGLEKERDFYFDKLRDIEIMLQDLEEAGQGNEHTAAILKILYQTAEGFEPIDEAVANTVADNKNGESTETTTGVVMSPVDETF